MATEKKETTAVAARTQGEVTYSVAGQDVKLSYQIVRDYLTKGNGTVTDQDLTQFISLCKYQELNPFLNEAYLVKYGQQPASIIVSREAFMKRAEAHPQYAGIKGGVIVRTKDNVLEHRTGTFQLKEEQLVGAWAEVHRKDRQFPTEATVAFYEYDKEQSTWKEKPGTMIVKVAKVQALREAFPAQLGALYISDEMPQQVEDADYQIVEEIKENANKQNISFNHIAQAAEQQQATEPKSTTSAKPEPEKAKENETPKEQERQLAF